MKYIDPDGRETEGNATHDLSKIPYSEQQKYNTLENNRFSEILRNSVGAEYSHERPPTKKKMDCSGSFVFGATEMGYDVPSNLTVKKMANGDLPGIEFYSDVTEQRQGQQGTLNIYTFNSGTYVHVNVGVGQKPNESKPQVIDATESNWMISRNTNANQIIPAKAGSLNQTFAPFSTNSKPELQARINWSVLPRK